MGSKRREKQSGRRKIKDTILLKVSNELTKNVLPAATVKDKSPIA
jgi:hypothetical protein